MGLSFLYAWELGENLGHVATFPPIAKRLLADGHRVTIAARETATVTTFTSQLSAQLLQAPYLTETPSPKPPLSYPDILLRFGLGQPHVLQGHVEAWRSIFELTKANLIIADHAPAALVAARTTNIPVMLFNSGFFVPPRQTPLPALRPWQPLPNQQLVDIELRLLKSINQCLHSFDAPPIQAAWELFEVAETTLLGFPEFDHYNRQGKISYWGYFGSADISDAPAWPDLPGQKIFAYLRAKSKHFVDAVNALIVAGQPTLIYCPDAPPAVQQALAAQPHIHHLTHLVNLAHAAKMTDLLVSYAGFFTTAAFIHAGKPVLLLPQQLEQFLFAKRIEKNGFGLMVHPEHGGQDTGLKLSRLLTEPVFRNNAETFRQRYINFSQNTVVDNILRRMLQLAGSP